MSKIFFVTLLLVIPIMGTAQSSEKKPYMLPRLFSDDGDGFVVIAHRGASADFPENTMAAFKGAVEMNAEMIELDVMMSKDGVPVVFHDAELKYHTDGQGKLKNFSLEELKKLDAGSWFDKKFAGQAIPTLEEVLAFASGKIALNIEIKTEAVSGRLGGGIEEKCLNLIRKYGMEEHVLFSSFDYRAVAHLKELDPDIPVALLYNKSLSDQKTPAELIHKFKADAFNCSFRQLNEKWVKDLDEQSIPFFVYTVDKESSMRKLLDWGASGIFTNKPDVLIEVVNRWNRDG